MGQIPDIDFKKIRLYKSSQRAAFEELCCQIENLNNPGNNATFYRKDGDGGDAGVEAYWKLQSGEEYGIQVKYFPDSLQETQWKQINESVTTALNKHPDLIRYTLYLPKDLSDSRVFKNGKKVKSQKERWDEYTAKWKEEANKNGIDKIFFIYKGAYEINHFLISGTNDPRIAGLIYYWFDKTLFTPEWFRDQYEIAEKNLGERYSPDKHLDLSINNIIDGLLINDNFRNKLKSKINDCYEKIENEIIKLKSDKTIDIQAVKTELIEFHLVNFSKMILPILFIKKILMNLFRTENN